MRQIKPMKDESLERFQKRVENIVSRSLSESFKGATGEEMTAKEIIGLKKAIGEWHKKNLHESCDHCDGTGLIEFEFKVDPEKDETACGYRPCPGCLEKIIYDRAKREDERKKKEKKDMLAREERIAARIESMMPGHEIYDPVKGHEEKKKRDKATEKAIQKEHKRREKEAKKMEERTGKSFYESMREIDELLDGAGEDE